MLRVLFLELQRRVREPSEFVVPEAATSHSLLLLRRGVGEVCGCVSVWACAPGANCMLCAEQPPRARELRQIQGAERPHLAPCHAYHRWTSPQYSNLIEQQKSPSRGD